MNPMMNPQHNRQSFGRRATSAFTRLLITVVILGLVGAVGFLLAQLNAHTFSVVQDNGQLVVMKGRMLPTGAAPYRPGDARLADAYAPIPLEGRDISSLLEQKFTERDELDRALFPVLEALARPKVLSDDPTLLDKGLYYLRRAELLSGLTEEQHRTLEAMKADVAFFQARQKLDQARREVTEALGQLKLAAESHNRNTQRANQLLSAVGPAARLLEQSLRAADVLFSGAESSSTPTETPLTAPSATGQPSGQPATSTPPPAAEPPSTGGSTTSQTPPKPAEAPSSAPATDPLH